MNGTPSPLKREVFSYAHLFRAVNTHILVPEPWNGDVAHDAKLIYEALGSGRSFVGYDALAPTTGFRFTAETGGRVYGMGDEFVADSVVHFHVQAPTRARLRLVHDGRCVAESVSTELMYATRAPGAYRVEAYRPYVFKQRGWVFGNPIFVRGKAEDQSNNSPTEDLT